MYESKIKRLPIIKYFVYAVFHGGTMKLFSVCVLVVTPLVIGILMGPGFDMLIKKVSAILKLFTQKGKE